MNSPARSFGIALLLAFLFWGLGVPAARAEIFKYVDEQGVTHYVESVQQVPERYRDRIYTIDGKLIPAYPSKAPIVPAEKPPEGAPLLTDRDGHTQVYWCLKKEELEKKIANLEKDRDELEGMGAVDLRQPGGVKTLQAIQDDLSETKKNLDAARAALDDLPKQLQKAGAPAGWLKGSRCPTEGPLGVGMEGRGGEKVPTEGELPAAATTREWWEAKRRALEQKRDSLTAQIAETEGKGIDGLGEIYDPVTVAYNKRLQEKAGELREQLAQVQAELDDLPNKAKAAGVPVEWAE